MEPKALSWSSPLIIWLLTGCILVFAMVVVGGITRLTGSGLSITEWNVIMCALPPLQESEWQLAFEKYQASPQFQQQNFHFVLDDFKQIFWWEYIHRLLGRVIGLVVLIPFCWFLIKKQISGALTYRLLFIFFLGGFQGFLGWYMVKSGLVDDPRVSHYRLAAHLLTALATFGFIYHTVLGLLFPIKKLTTGALPGIYRLSLFLFIILTLQLTYGAFVAGLKAGLVYNTFPKMGDEWVAASVGMAFEKDGLVSLLDNLASVQFIHRTLAYALVVEYLVLLFNLSRLKVVRPEVKAAIHLTGFVLIVQFLLGVFTLLYRVPVAWGVIHQAGAFLLLTAMLYQLFIIRHSRN